MNAKQRADLIKLIIFLIVSITITISVVATLLDQKSFSVPLIGLQAGQTQTSYHALFTNATDLESGDVVRIAGVEVGKVKSVSAFQNPESAPTMPGVWIARVNFTVDSSQHLTTNALAKIDFENLLGQRYLEIKQGAPGGDPLRSGGEIGLAHTTPGLDLTDVFTGFQPLLAALDPHQVNLLTGSIIQVLQGETGAVSGLINQTAALTSNLASRQQLINQIINNLAPLLTSVNQNDSQLKQLIDGLATLVHGLAGERQQVGGAITGLANLDQNTVNLLNNVQPTLDQDLNGLKTVTGILTQNQNQLDNQLGTVLQGLPGLLNALDKASSSGNFLTVYICDLTIATTNPISVKLSPGVPQSPPLSVPTGLIGVSTFHTPVCSLGPSA